MHTRTFMFLPLLVVLAIPVVGDLDLWAIDDDYWRGVVSRHVEAATGRKLEIGGPLTIQWASRPSPWRA